MLAVLLVAGTLEFTVPRFNADPLRPCEAASAEPELYGWWRLHAQRQSPTWLAKRDSMLADDATWARYWPTVVAEAARVMLSRTALAVHAGGSVVTFVPAPGWTFYFVTVEDEQGNVSCRSNIVGAP